MTFDYTQGDPALKLTEEGADLEFKNGQPVMDSGIQNAALISLFTAPGWWGNALTNTDSQKIGSDLEAVAKQAITVSAIRKIQAAAERALNWMIETGLALSIVARVNNPRSNWVELGVGIKPPSKDAVVLATTRHGSNWIAQRDYPAYRRMGE